MPCSSSAAKASKFNVQRSTPTPTSVIDDRTNEQRIPTPTVFCFKLEKSVKGGLRASALGRSPRRTRRTSRSGMFNCTTPQAEDAGCWQLMPSLRTELHFHQVELHCILGWSIKKLESQLKLAANTLYSPLHHTVLGF
ncbi:hypothetical protein K439DRAFT_1610554 [Ramaria rubella]|nr:hypothetical protein K439DRAFT_1610554 [Ramaria rubella]